MNKKEIKNKQNSSIGYEGKVKVEIKYGNKTLKKSNFHNTGLLPLFNCLAKNIVGNYSEAENLRPKYIRIFTIGNSGEPVPEFESFTELEEKNTTHLSSLTTIIYTGEPNITEASEGVKVQFKFLIPFTQLSFFNNLNMIALYCQQYKTELTNADAYIIVSNKNQETGEEVLSDLLANTSVPSQAEANKYNLFIEWDMIFKNI